jgi:hypothetical protein
MAWCASVRTWNSERKMYDSLILRIEDTPEPGCLVRLYDGETAAAEALAESPQLARIFHAVSGKESPTLA